MTWTTKKARELNWDDTEMSIQLLSGSEWVRARVIMHRDQRVVVSDAVTGKVLTLSPEDYVRVTDKPELAGRGSNG